jgi:parallel beta-helix repeat protein
VSFNKYHGIIIKSSTKNTIWNNILLNNTFYGIEIVTADKNNISFNMVSYNKGRGINIVYSHNNIISNNNVSSNTYYGISLDNANDNKIINNTVCFNNLTGIYPHLSINNSFFYNTIINNTKQASDGVIKNKWDNSYPLGGNYWSDYNGIDNYKGPNQDQPGRDGIGDTYYLISPDSMDKYPLMKPYTHKPLVNYTILQRGWNLISFPLIQDIQSLTKVLEMIDGYYDAVQWHNPIALSDSWKHYRPSKPFGNDLTHLNESMGFWIHITNPGDTIFIYNGTQPTSNQTINLSPGWNMVGYPSLSNRNRTAALNNINYGSDVDAIWTFNAATQTWQEIGPSDQFELGRGYWIHSKVTKVWDVPL